jgi:lipid A 4'-phosphatase
MTPATYLAFIIPAFIITIFPAIDLWFSHLFFSDTNLFFWHNLWIVKLLYQSIYYILIIATIIFLTSFIMINVFNIKQFLTLDNRKLCYLIMALIIGPGIVINSGFKDHLGRARPAQITEFDGKQKFTAPLMPSHACKKNCSFPSGHASIGFYLSAFGFIAGKYRDRIIKLSIIAGLAIGLGRIIQGGHFLSDIIFSGLIVLSINHLLYRLML